MSGHGIMSLIEEFKNEPKWFSTSKPLPDGDYGWRLNKDDDPRPRSVSANFIFEIGVKRHISDKFSVGEWCELKFPD